MSSIIYIPHGGGPIPLLDGSGHENIIDFLRNLSENIVKPDAILVISAHWEEDKISVVCNKDSDLLYDYYGFPEEAYQIEYNTTCALDVAKNIFTKLKEKNIDCELNQNRNFDHGVFVPLKLIYPDADIPVTQISLNKNLDPSLHLRVGEALKDLKYENILILGSGFSFHNMQEFFSPKDQDPENDQFQEWLIETCCNLDLDKEEIFKRLVNWANAPGAKYCHPREEHLIPLHVCQGIAGKAGELIFDNKVVGKRTIAIKW